MERFLKQTKRNPVSDNRRKWLYTTGRWGVFCLIASVFGGLWKRNGISMYRHTCADPKGEIGCRRCGYLNECGHPKALSAKRIIVK